MNENKVVNRLFWTIASAVILIALGSFVWSFLSLWSLAEANSSQAGLGWIWPLIVDTSMVIYTGAILVAQLQRRGAKLPISLTIFYAGVTITGNVLHAPQTPLGWFVAVLPPLSLIFGTEMLRAMGHHIIERQAVVGSLAELTRRRDQAQAERDKLMEAIKTAKETSDHWLKLVEFFGKDTKVGQKEWQELRQLIWERDGKNCVRCRKDLSTGETYHCHHILPTANGGKGAPANLVTLCEECHDKTHTKQLFVHNGEGSLEYARQAKQAKIEARRGQVLDLLGQKVGQEEIASRLGVSVRTVRNDITALNGKVKVTL